MTWDNNGNVATVTERRSQTTTYTYDPLNRRTKATFQDGTSTNYTYDAGNRITCTYDGLDCLTQEGTAHGTVNYTNDNASTRATMTVAGQPQVTYSYDNANRFTTIVQGTSTVTIRYDDADRRTSVTYPNTNKVKYAYNAASELTAVTYKQGTTTLGKLSYPIRCRRESALDHTQHRWRRRADDRGFTPNTDNASASLATTNPGILVRNVVTTPTSITATFQIAFSAAAGPATVTVTTTTGSATTSFSMNASAPVLSTLSTTSGPVTRLVTITGNGFSTTAGLNQIKFNGLSATTLSATEMTLPT